MIHIPSLFSACIQLAAHSGKIIRAIQATGDLQVIDKGCDDPCTLADRSSEQVIVSTLSYYFPDLCVIGEENMQASPEHRLELPTSSIPLDLLPESLHHLPADKLVVWVDPLDGTKSYTLGDYKYVTTLIGVAYESQPIFGVIHQVFAENHPVYWGGPGIGVYRTNDPGQVGELYDSPQATDYSFTITRSHYTECIAQFIQFLQPERTLSECGAGFKALSVLAGTAAVYLYPSAGCCKWDTCAAQALIEAAGGSLTDMFGQKYSYGKEVETQNKNGLVASRNGEYLSRVVTKWSEFI